MEIPSKNTVVLFPSRPGTSEIDASFHDEMRAAAAAGFETALVDEGELAFGGDVRLSRLPHTAGVAIYRGWLLRAPHYQRLSEEVEKRGYQLLTAPEAYLNTYHLPEWYAAIEDTGLTPRSIWIPGTSFDVAEVAARVEASFGSSAVILKDYVKSRKHEWFEACFIPDARDTEAVERVIRRFLELQDEALVGGLVFREYWPTHRLGSHPKSRAPLANEHRLFVLHGRVFFSAPYWSVVEYGPSRPPEGLTAPVLSRGISPFFAVDVAEREDGGWFIVELNDGGSAGLPQPELANEFYRALATALDEATGSS
jgi:ATP-grasp domain-containing protein